MSEFDVWVDGHLALFCSAWVLLGFTSILLGHRMWGRITWQGLAASVLCSVLGPIGVFFCAVTIMENLPDTPIFKDKDEPI